MRSPRPHHPRSVLARIILTGVLLALWSHADASTLSAQEPPQVVALDRSTADLLRSCFPAIVCEVLVQVEDEPFGALNARAWSIRDAGVLVFRSDRVSATSLMFRERLMAQGVRVVDLTAHLSIDRAFRIRLEAAAPAPRRLAGKRLLATTAPIDSGRAAD